MSQHDYLVKDIIARFVLSNHSTRNGEFHLQYCCQLLLLVVIQVLRVLQRVLNTNKSTSFDKCDRVYLKEKVNFKLTLKLFMFRMTALAIKRANS